MFQNFDATQQLLNALLRLPGILIGFAFHEYAHAYTAVKFGDPTPERDGRLSLNPFAHIDIWGLLLFMFTGFGWAKPVRTNPSYYHGDVRRKDMIVSFAGPVTNLIITFISVILYFALMKLGLFNTSSNNVSIVLAIIKNIIYMNCVMFVFNIVPIPPLDGFHVLVDLMPGLPYNFVNTLERYGFLILMVFILSSASDYVIGTASIAVMNAIVRTVSFMFGGI